MLNNKMFHLYPLYIYIYMYMYIVECPQLVGKPRCNQQWNSE